MKLSIVVPDGAVYVDGYCISGLNMSTVPVGIRAMQWNGSFGHIEYNDSANEDISSLPNWVDVLLTIWTGAKALIESPPQLSDDEKLIKNANEAEFLLKESDWSVLPDVELLNIDDWKLYRSSLRQIRKNPTLDPIWPVKPIASWV